MSYSAGLYIGSDFVDLVVLEMTKGRYNIVKSIRSMYSEAAESRPEKQREKIGIVGGAIKDTIETAGLKVNLINFSLPQDEIIIRNFKMPYLSEEDRANGVKFEALKYIPFKIDSVLSDFYVISEAKDAKSMDVLFVGINRQAVDKYLTFFKESKIGLHIGDIAPLALMRLLYVDKKITKDHTQVLVYLEKDAKCTIIIINDGNLSLVKEVSLSAAKEIIFDTISNNLRLSIDYFKRETRQLSIDRISVCGEGQLTELQAYLKEGMPNIDINIFELGDEIKGLNELSRRQLIAIGLAMASFEKPKPKINLFNSLPQPVTFSSAYKEYKPLFIQAGAMVVFLIVLQIFMSISVNGTKASLNRIKSATPGIRGINSDIPLSGLQGMEEKFSLRLRTLKELVGGDRLFLVKKLSVLGSLMPEGSWIESFEFSDEMNKARKLSIDGVVYSKEKDEAALANKILVEMKQSRDFSEGFNDIRIDSLKRTNMYNKEVLTFSIICTGEPIPSSDMFSGLAGARTG